MHAATPLALSPLPLFFFFVHATHESDANSNQGGQGMFFSPLTDSI